MFMALFTLYGEKMRGPEGRIPALRAHEILMLRNCLSTIIRPSL